MGLKADNAENNAYIQQTQKQEMERTRNTFGYNSTAHKRAIEEYSRTQTNYKAEKEQASQTVMSNVKKLRSTINKLNQQHGTFYAMPKY